jgi:cell division protein ZapA (FtsZ GTPase activity inhibitor)
LEKAEISIKVNIADRFYPLRIPVVEEKNVRKAAQLINEKAKYYHENFSVQDKQDALAMAALEFASDLLNAQDKETATNEFLDKKLESISSVLRHVGH